MRKATTPKKKMTTSGVAIFSKFGIRSAPHHHNHIKPKKQEHSKFFFDMLVAVCHGVVGENILPHLPPLNTKEGMALFSLMHQYGDGGGLFRQSLMGDIIMPAFDSAPPKWATVTINMSDYFHLSSGIDIQAFLTTIHNGSNVVPKLCMDFVQCAGCMAPCRWGGVAGGFAMCTCINARGLDCIQVADTYLHMMQIEKVSIHKLVIKGIDTSTPVGLRILNYATLIMETVGGPTILHMENICSKRTFVDMLCSLVSDCMRTCTTVSLDSWTIIGSTIDTHENSYIVSYIPAAILEAIDHRMVTSLTITNCSLPFNKLEIGRCARAIMGMSKLGHLVLNCKVRVCWKICFLMSGWWF